MGEGMDGSRGALTGASRPKERPILFSGPMVRALLEGRKTVTRRIVKPQPIAPMPVYGRIHPALETLVPEIRCPYGKPGDRLWVRETHQYKVAHSCYDTCDCDDFKIVYTADGAHGWPSGPVSDDWGFNTQKIYPSIHMPRWASRINLEVTEVLIERLQDITEADAQAEGVQPIPLGPSKHQFYLDYSLSGDGSRCTHNARESFETLWKKINGPESWDANPWVWAVSFRVLGAQRPGAERPEQTTVTSELPTPGPQDKKGGET